MEKPKLWKWEEGRQKSGYKKLCLFYLEWPIAMDMYLLKYERGNFIAPHRDVVQGKKHYRCNVTLRKACKGGKFSCEKVLFNFWRVCLFRPDISTHSVTEISQGSRVLFSIGWAI